MSKSTGINRVLTLELARVTERAAVAAAGLIGRGDEKAADQAAVDAMRRELNSLEIDGEVVIGEGERQIKVLSYYASAGADSPKGSILLDSGTVARNTSDPTMAQKHAYSFEITHRGRYARTGARA